MEVAGTQSWVENARAAARILRVRAPAKSPPPADSDFPEAPAALIGLRGMEQTQSLEVHQTKGLIVDIYL